VPRHLPSVDRHHHGKRSMLQYILVLPVFVPVCIGSMKGDGLNTCLASTGITTVSAAQKPMLRVRCECVTALIWPLSY
jgi:ABC-type transport system involved in cytochrome c biogenesis permease component